MQTIADMRGVGVKNRAKCMLIFGQISMNSELPNKQADQNTRLWKESFFIYNMKIEWMLDFFPKKLNEHALLLGSLEYLILSISQKLVGHFLKVWV